jgi:hypothetical protein
MVSMNNAKRSTRRMHDAKRVLGVGMSQTPTAFRGSAPEEIGLLEEIDLL